MPFHRAASIIFLIFAALFLVLPRTASAQVWVSSAFTAGPGDGQETATCSTSAVDPSTGQATQTAADYDQFSVYCSVTPSNGAAAITSSQCPPLVPESYIPLGAYPADNGNPTAQCSITFPIQTGIEYTVNSVHFLSFNTVAYNGLYSDPEGFFSSDYDYYYFSNSTQGTSIAQEVTCGIRGGSCIESNLYSGWGVMLLGGTETGYITLDPYEALAATSACFGPTCICPDPTLTSVTPNIWNTGTSYNVTATGTGFVTSANAWADCPMTNLFIYAPTGAVPFSNMNVVSPTQITFTVQPQASYPTEPGSIEAFNYSSSGPNVPVQIVNCAPTIASIAPSAWFAGQTYSNVTITGTNFVPPANATATCPATAVTATMQTGNVNLTNVTVVSPTQITATAAPDANIPTQIAEITVSNPGASAGTFSDGFGYASSTDAQSTARQPVLGNQLFLNGGANAISTTDGSQPPVQTVVVGQQVALTTPDLPDGISATSTTWTVGGTNIGGYIASSAGGSVLPTATSSTLNPAPTSLTTYWVYPGSSIPVTYQYCVDILVDLSYVCSPIATAEFDITGPTGGAMSVTPFAPSVTIADLAACTDLNGTAWPAGPYLFYAQRITGSICAPAGTVGINFNDPTGYLNASGGSFSLVQLIGSDVVTGGCCTWGPGLDTQYPAGSPPYDDSPFIYLPPTANSASRTFAANMFLMWNSSMANSIPVPLGYQQWGFSSTAICSSNCGSASNWTAANTPGTTPGPVGNFVPSSPSQKQTNDGYNILEDGYPTWTSVSK